MLLLYRYRYIRYHQYYLYKLRTGFGKFFEIFESDTERFENDHASMTNSPYRYNTSIVLVPDVRMIRYPV
jgi:hypothetical protein